jgi:hypothetical protein
MAERQSIAFSGTVLRFERDGFGIIQFDQPIGPSSNSYGIISNSTGTTVVYPDPSTHYTLKPGTRVTGTAEADERDVAAVKTVTIKSAS